MDYNQLAKKFGGTQETPSSGGVDYSSLAQKFGGTPASKVGEVDAGTGNFNVAPVRPNLKTLQAEAEVAKVESDKANSFGGKTKNFLKAFAENTPIVGSAIKVGRDLGESLGASGNAEVLSQADQGKSDTLLALTKQINKNKLLGKDNTKLMQEYNRLKGETTPTIEDISPTLKKTNLEVGGDLAMLAVDTLTAGTYGRAATGAKNFARLKPSAVSLAQKAIFKPTGIFTKEGASKIALSGGTGYAYDVANNAQKGKTGPAMFKPGLGTLISLAIPTASEGQQSIKNVMSGENKYNRIVGKREKALDVLDSYSTLKKVVIKNKEKGTDVKKIIASTDLLHGAVDKNGTINTKVEGGAIEQLQDFIKPQEKVISDRIAKEGISLPVSVIKRKLQSQVDNSGLEGAALTRAHKEVAADLAGYMRRADKNGNIPLGTIHSAKTDKYANLNYLTEIEKQKAGKAIAKGLKELVEENVKSADVKKLNGELSKYYAVLDYLEKLDGKKVEGGRLGKYFAKTIGGIVGSKFGPLGTIVGSEVAGGIKGASMARTFDGKTGKVLQYSDDMSQALTENKIPKQTLALPAGTVGGAKVQNFVPIRASAPTQYEAPAGVIRRYSSPSKVSAPIVAPATEQGAKRGIMRYSETRVEPYTDPKSLPTIPFGNKAKPKVDNVPTLQIDKLKAPSVFAKVKETFKKASKDQGGYIASQSRDPVGRFANQKIHPEDVAEAKDFVDYFDGIWGKDNKGKSTLSPEAEHNLIQSAFRIAEKYGGTKGKTVSSLKGLANFLEQLSQGKNAKVKGSIAKSPLGVIAGGTAAVAAAGKVYRYSKDKKVEEDK